MDRRLELIDGRLVADTRATAPGLRLGGDSGRSGQLAWSLEELVDRRRAPLHLGVVGGGMSQRRSNSRRTTMMRCELRSSCHDRQFAEEAMTSPRKPRTAATKCAVSDRNGAWPEPSSTIMRLPF